MSLPPLIEIIPPAAPVRAEITVPGSKSITNRALVLAALAEGETVLSGALWSEDTQVMVDCLRDLGFMVNVASDPHESANRTVTVYGVGGQVPRGGTPGQPLELFVGNAGTAARFLTAMCCLGQGVYRLDGVPRMRERPQAALFQALRQLGYRVDSPNDKLPALVFGHGPLGRQLPPPTSALGAAACRVSITESSQFASALLLSAKAGGWTVHLSGANAEESAYVAMTSKLCAAFPERGGTFQIEPDASSGSYFLAAGIVINPGSGISNSIHVAHWPASGWQIDAAFPRFWPLPKVVSRQTDLGDSILTAMILAPFAEQPVQFTDLGRLRVQECERVAAMRQQLMACGARVTETGDCLEILPSPLHGAEIETYNDHRIAMCFGVLALRVPGIKIRNPGCVRKTFPNFFQKLAAPPPAGLGVTLLDSRTSRPIRGQDLDADDG
jgi:3-phosphoshikimate 1-carboxyvinyltransferase